MKQIKKIVLKDATRLTNSEMKSIRGGYEPEKEYLSSCFVTCEMAGNPILETTCVGTKESHCDVISGANGTHLGVGCFMDSYGVHQLLPNTDILCTVPIPSEKMR